MACIRSEDKTCSVYIIMSLSDYCISPDVFFCNWNTLSCYKAFHSVSHTQLTAFLKILVCKHTAEQNVVAPMYFEVNKRNEVCKPEVWNAKPSENRLQPCSQPLSSPARCVQPRL